MHKCMMETNKKETTKILLIWKNTKKKFEYFTKFNYSSEEVHL